MAPIYIMIDQKATGRNIVRLMTACGIRVKDVQEACGFEKPQAVYKWIHGQSLPSIDNLIILSKLFDTSMEGIIATSEDALPRYPGDAGSNSHPAGRFLRRCRDHICEILIILYNQGTVYFPVQGLRFQTPSGRPVTGGF